MALEQVFAATPAVGDGGRIIASPFQFLFTGEDKLQLLVVNSAAGVTVQLATRFLVAGAKAPQASAPTFTPTADRTVNTFNIDVGAGYLLNCSAIVVAGSPLVGQTYVMVRILRGATGATLMLGAMLGGYVTAKQALAYPGSPIESSIAGGGYYRSIVGTTPAVGVEFTETVPTGARWQLVSLYAGLSTSNVAGTRYPRLIIENVATRYAVPIPTVGIAPNVNADCTWADGLSATSLAALNGFSQGLAVDAILLAGADFRTSTPGLAINDQWGAPNYLVREWLEAA